MPKTIQDLQRFNLPPEVRLSQGDMYCDDHPLTVDEFYELIDEDSNAELVNGVIIMPSPASLPHEELFMFLAAALRTYVEAMGLGIVLGSRTAVRIDRHSAREPDVLFVRKSRRHIVRKQEIVGAPDLVVEIVSPGDCKIEIITKQAQYETIGVPELWLLDLRHERATILRLNRQRRYDVFFTGASGLIEPMSVPGFTVKVEWFWRESGARPNPLALVNSLVKKAKRKNAKKG